MSSDKLTHLIYASAATPEFNDSDLPAILEGARRNNSRRSVTGMLLYTTGSFFQVLEGDEPTLLELFTIISLDSRHQNVTKIIHEPIAKRAFGEWTMGYSEIETSDLEKIEGLNDFFQLGASLTDLQPGRAKKLLAAFAQGRWRTRLTGGGA